MRKICFVLVLIPLLSETVSTTGQQPPPGLPTPRINTIFPFGAKAGTTVEVTVAGFDLEDPSGLYFSHPGIKGEHIVPKEVAVDPKKKEMPVPKKRNPGDPHQFKVTVDPSVPLGTYDLRVSGKWGVSNPRAFVVGDSLEVNEKEPNNDVPEAQRIELGTTVNGIISNPTDVDYTVFAGKKGDRVIISCLASSIDSRAKPRIEVYDVNGRKLAVNSNYKDTDALTDLVIPADGDYHIRLFEFTHLSGGPDHGYRLTVNTAPWIDSVFPPAIEFGMPTQVTLFGRNLPGGKPEPGMLLDGKALEKTVVTITPPTDSMAAQRLNFRGLIDPLTALQDGFEYRIRGPGGFSNAVLIYFAREKLVFKKGSSLAKPDSAEALPIPCELVATLPKQGDRDWFSFVAKKGEIVYLELTSDRNGSQSDFYFTVHNSSAKNDMMGPEQDDDPEILHPTDFYNRTADPAPYRFVAPMDAKYLVAIGSRVSGSQTAYRLRIGPARPDYRVIVKPFGKVIPTGSALRQESTEAIEIYIHRMDGFAGTVTVSAESLPAGVTSKPVAIGPGARWGVLVLESTAEATLFTGPIIVKAKAKIDTKEVIREARPAVVIWPGQPGQNTPVLTRLTDSLVLGVRTEKGSFKIVPDLSTAVIKNASGKDEKVSGTIALKQGEKLTLPVKINWQGGEKQNITLSRDPIAANPALSPITMQPGTQPTKDKPEGVVTFDVRSNAIPGVYSLELRGDAQVPFAKDPAAKQKPNIPVTVFSQPISITVIPLNLAKITVGQIANIKPGATEEVTIKLERQFEYAGEFKVKYTAPMGTTGIVVEDVTISAGKVEGKMFVKVAADAKPGAVNGGTISLTGKFAGEFPVTQETKVNFTIVK